MRYTAATCDPDDFKDERYTLRQVLFDPPRRTELFICLTMYNVRTLEPFLEPCFTSALLTPAHCMHVTGGRPALYKDDAWCDEQHCPSLYQRQIKDLGKGRLEKGRRVHCQRWAHEDQQPNIE